MMLLFHQQNFNFNFYSSVRYMDIEYRISIRFDNYSVVSFLLFHCIDFMNENDYFFGGCQDSIFGFTVVYGAY